MICTSPINVASGSTLSSEFSLANVTHAAIIVGSLATATTMHLRAGVVSNATYRIRSETGSGVTFIHSGAVTLVLPTEVLGFGKYTLELASAATAPLSMSLVKVDR